MGPCREVPSRGLHWAFSEPAAFGLYPKGTAESCRHKCVVRVDVVLFGDVLDLMTIASPLVAVEESIE